LLYFFSSVKLVCSGIIKNRVSVKNITYRYLNSAGVFNGVLLAALTLLIPANALSAAINLSTVDATAANTNNDGYILDGNFTLTTGSLKDAGATTVSGATKAVVILNNATAYTLTVNNGATIENTNTTTNDNNGPYAIQAIAGVNAGTKIINNGTILNSANVSRTIEIDATIDSIYNGSTGIMRSAQGRVMNITSTITNGITNDGLMQTLASGGGAGINIAAGGNAGTITNNGTINTISGPAIATSGASTTTIINTGTLSGTSGNVISIAGGALTGKIQNDSTGTISSSGNVIMTSQDVSGGIINSGLIQSTGSSAITVSSSKNVAITNNSGATITTSANIAAINDSATLTHTGLISNAGTISNTSTTGNAAHGVSFSTLATGLTNTGTISAASTSSAAAVRIAAVTSGGISNTGGTMTSYGTVGTLLLAGNNDIVGDITNTGIIQNLNTTAASRIAIDLALQTTAGSAIGIINSGTITGRVKLGNADTVSQSAGSISSEATTSTLTGGTTTGLINITGGSVTNTSVAATGDAISVTTLSNGLSNAGTISSTATGAASALRLGAVTTGGITNTSIMTSYGTDGTIILTGDSDIVGDITNSGTIQNLNVTAANRVAIDLALQTTAGSAIGIINSGTITGRVKLGNADTVSQSAGSISSEATTSTLTGGTTTGLINITGGTVSNTSVAATGDAISVTTLSAGLSNAGTISSTATGAASALRLSAVTTGGISNSGTLTSYGTDGTITLSSDSDIVGDITNTSTIQNLNVTEASRVAIDLSAQTTLSKAIGIINSGTITGQVKLGNGDTISQTAGTISAAGSSVILGGTTTGLINITGGTVSNTSTSSTGDAISVTTLSNGLSNAGTISSTATGAASALRLSAVTTGGINNASGFITSYGTDGTITLSADGDIIGDITNSGTIENLNTTAASRVAIDLSAQTTLGNAIGIINSGTITGQVKLGNGDTVSQTAGSISGVGSSVILGGSTTGLINITGGTISNTSIGSTGDAISVTTLSAGLTNTATISSTATGAASAVKLSAVTTGGINNTGGFMTSYGTDGTILLTGDNDIVGDINNTGTIRNLNATLANRVAIDLSAQTTSGKAIGIINSGTIIGQVKLGNADTVSQTAGSISGVGSSVILGGTTTGLINITGGTISNTSVGSTGDAISVTTLSNGLTLDNATISSTATGAAAAIRLAGASAGGITNTSGFITSYGTDGAITLTGDNDIAGDITNTGTIQNLNATAANRIAIDLSAQTTAGNAIDLINSGTITGQVKLGNADSVSQSAGIITGVGSSVILGGTTTGMININGGTISNTSTGSTGDAISVTTLLNGISNTGTISSTATGAASAIKLSAISASGLANTGGTITSYGTNGTILLTGDNDIVGDIYNSGTIQNLNSTASSRVAIDLSAQTTSGNAVDLINAGTITGQVKLGNASTVSQSAGSISGAGSSVILGGTTTGMINVTGGTISNTSVAATGDAISVTTLLNGLANTGTISSTATGAAAAVRLGGVSASGISNTGGTITSYGTDGTITLSADGGIVGDIYNSGTIQSLHATAANRVAIDLSAQTTAGNAFSLINAGTITGKVKLGNADTVSQTAGTITGVGSSVILGGATTGLINITGGSVSNTSVGGTGDAISVTTLTNGLTNTGTISSTATGAASAVRLAAVTSGGIANTGGTITSYGTDGAITLSADGNIVGGITNTGTIQSLHATAANRVAIDLSAQTTAGNSFTIANSGTIAGRVKLGNHDVFTQTAGSTSVSSGTAILGYAGGTGETLNIFGGSISGNIDMGGAGTNVADNGDTINFGNHVSDTFTIAGTTNFDDMNIAFGTTTFNGAATGRNATSTLTVAQGATLVANENISSSGIRNINGQLEIAAGKSVAGAGDVTIGSTGTVIISVIDANTYGKMTGASFSMDSGGKIEIDASNITTIAKGTRLNFYTGTAARGTFTPGIVLTDNSSLYKFIQETPLIDDGFSIDIRVASEGNIQDSVPAPDSSAGSNSIALANNSAVAVTLDNIGSDGDAALDNVINTILSYSSDEEMQSAVASLLPTNQTSGATTQAVMALSDASIGTVENRMELVRNGDSSTGIASGDPTNDKGMWVQAFGTAAKQDVRNGIQGYKANIGGATFGADNLINDDLRVGASFSYGNTTAKGNSNKASINSYQGTVYSSYTLGKAYIDGLAAYTYNQYDTSRYLFDGTTAAADYNGQQYSAKATLGYNLGMPSSIQVTPFTSAQYILLQQDRYTETGSSANLTVKSDDMDIFKAGLGTKLAYIFTEGGYTVTPSITVAAYHDFGSDKVSTTSNFTSVAGFGFHSTGADVARDSYNLGAGLTIYSDKETTISFDYSYDMREDFNAHTGSIKVRLGI